MSNRSFLTISVIEAKRFLLNLWSKKKVLLKNTKKIDLKNQENKHQTEWQINLIKYLLTTLKAMRNTLMRFLNRPPNLNRIET